MHLVRFSCLPIVTLVSLLLHCRPPRRVRESATVTPSSAATVSLVIVPADAVIAVRARILLVLAPPSVSLPCSMLSMLPSTSKSYPNAVARIAWHATDRETLLKAASRQRFTETSGIKIRAFLADAELFLTLCSRPRDC